MGVAAALSWWAVETLYLDTQRDNLLAQAELAAAALGGQPLAATAAEPYLQTANVLPGIHTRVARRTGGGDRRAAGDPGAGPVQAALGRGCAGPPAEDLLRARRSARPCRARPPQPSGVSPQSRAAGAVCRRADRGGGWHGERPGLPGDAPARAGLPPGMVPQPGRRRAGRPHSGRPRRPPAGPPHCSPRLRASPSPRPPSAPGTCTGACRLERGIRELDEPGCKPSTR